MANLCCYELYARGTKEGIEKLHQMLSHKEKPYVVNSMYCSDLYAGEIRENGDGTYSQVFSSATRWSVAGAMLDEERDSEEYCTLQTAAKLTETVLELYSEEPGCCFAEHVEINPDGEYTIETRPFYYFDGEDIAAETGPDPEKDKVAEYILSHVQEIGNRDELESLLDIEAATGFLESEGYISIGGFDGNSSSPFVLE